MLNYKWYVGKNEEKLGPFTQEEMEHSIRTGKFIADDLTWRKGMADWAQIEDVEELSSLLYLPQWEANAPKPEVRADQEDSTTPEQAPPPIQRPIPAGVRGEYKDPEATAQIFGPPVKAPIKQALEVDDPEKTISLFAPVEEKKSEPLTIKEEEVESPVEDSDSVPTEPLRPAEMPVKGEEIKAEIAEDKAEVVTPPTTPDSIPASQRMTPDPIDRRAMIFTTDDPMLERELRNPENQAPLPGIVAPAPVRKSLDNGDFMVEERNLFSPSTAPTPFPKASSISANLNDRNSDSRTEILPFGSPINREGTVEGDIGLQFPAQPTIPSDSIWKRYLDYRQSIVEMLNEAFRNAHEPVVISHEPGLAIPSTITVISTKSSAATFKLAIRIDVYPFCSTEFVPTLEITRGNLTEIYPSLLAFSQRHAEAAATTAVSNKPFPREFQNCFRRNWWELWRAENSGPSVKADVLRTISSLLIITGIPCLFIGVGLLMIGGGWLLRRYLDKRFHFLKIPDAPTVPPFSNLRVLETGHALLLKSELSVSLFHQRLLAFLRVAGAPITRDAPPENDDRAEITLQYAGAIATLRIKQEQKNVLLCWETSVNQSQWSPVEVARRIDSKTGKPVRVMSFEATTTAPDGVDIARANLLANWLHHRILQFMQHVESEKSGKPTSVSTLRL